MKLDYGKGKTEFGPGVLIQLTGNELCRAIDAFIKDKGLEVKGPRTVRIAGHAATGASVYVDPAGLVIHKGKKYSGRGPSVRAVVKRTPVFIET